MTSQEPLKQDFARHLSVAKTCLEDEADWEKAVYDGFSPLAHSLREHALAASLNSQQQQQQHEVQRAYMLAAEALEGACTCTGCVVTASAVAANDFVACGKALSSCDEGSEDDKAFGLLLELFGITFGKGFV